jgi:hypothetical protein
MSGGEVWRTPEHAILVDPPLGKTYLSANPHATHIFASYQSIMILLACLDYYQPEKKKWKWSLLDNHGHLARIHGK